MTDDILSRSTEDIVALYRSKRVSPVEVLTATLDRIDRLDRLYNAFVMIDRDGAHRDARASEERRTYRWIAVPTPPALVPALRHKSADVGEVPD